MLIADILKIFIKFNQWKFLKNSIDSFPLQNETTSEVYVGDFGLHD